jgi:hypothetical protein
MSSCKQVPTDHHATCNAFFLMRKEASDHDAARRQEAAIIHQSTPIHAPCDFCHDAHADQKPTSADRSKVYAGMWRASIGQPGGHHERFTRKAAQLRKIFRQNNPNYKRTLRERARQKRLARERKLAKAKTTKAKTTARPFRHIDASQLLRDVNMCLFIDTLLFGLP